MQWSNANRGQDGPAVARTPGIKAAMLSVAIAMTVPGNLLYLMHIPYGQPDSPIYAKFHPTMLIACVAFAQFVARRGIGRAGLSAEGARFFIFTGSAFLLSLVMNMAVQGLAGMATMFNTFFPAIAIAFILQNATEAERNRFVTMIVYLTVGNALLCIFENIFEYQLIPPYYNGVLFTEPLGEFRGYALYDHPLDGAMMTMIGIFATLATQSGGLRARACFAILLMGQIAFGGRTALLVVLAVLVVFGIRFGFRELMSARTNIQRMLGIIATAISVPGIILAVFFLTPIGQRIANRLYFDDSTQARAVEMKIFPMMTAHDYFFGIPFDRLRLMIWQVGLDVPFNDIENFWILELIDLGVIGFIFWFFGFWGILVWGYRAANAWGRVLLICVVLVASTSNSIGRKSNLLNVLFPAVICTAAARKRDDPAVAVAMPTPRFMRMASAVQRPAWVSGRSRVSWNLPASRGES